MPDPHDPVPPKPRFAGLLRVGEWVVDPALDEIRGDGRTIKLEPRKMQLLLALAQRPGELVTTEELFETVWTDVVVTPSSIYQSIAQLRKTLGDDAGEPRYIATVPRKGYRLLSDVVPLDPAPARPPPATVSGALEASAVRATDAATAQAGPGGQLGSSWRRRALIAAGAAAATTAGGGLVLWRRATAPAPMEVIRVAVLPFYDDRGGATPDPFATGLTDEVQAQFERRVGWQVTSRSATIQVAARGLSLAEIAQQLQVGWLLRGHMRRADGRIAAQVDLVAPAASAPVWSGSFERSSVETVKLADDIVAAVERALHVPASQIGALKLPTRDVAALEELYLGQQQLMRATPEGVRSARDHFQRAIEIDPEFARSYAALALGWMAGYNFEGVTLRDALHRAQPLAEKALALDGTLAAGHAVQGFIYLESLRLADAEARLQRALELSPNNAQAQFWLAMTAQYDARPLEAATRFARARLLDPVNFLVPSLQSLAFADLAQYADARGAVKQAQALAPSHPTPCRCAGRVEFAEGRLDGAVHWYRRATELGASQFTLWRERAWIELDLGHADEAAAAFEQALRTQPKLPMFLYELGGVYLSTGSTRGVADVDARLNARMPLSPGAQAGWAWLFAARNDSRRAMELLRPVSGEVLANALPLDGPNDYFLGISVNLDIASAYVADGDERAAAPFIDLVERALLRFEQQRVIWHGASYLLARIAAMRGARDEALKRLEQAVARGFRRSWRLNLDPQLRALAEEPRFVAAVRTINSENAAARARLLATETGR